ATLAPPSEARRWRSAAAEPDAPVSSKPSESGARTRDRTIAVLPLRNAGAAADGYLPEELGDDLIDALSTTAGLKLRPRSALAPFRDADATLDPREAGRALGVELVVLGSVRKAAGEVRMNVRLIGVADGFQLWAGRFRRAEGEVLAMNDEIARAILTALT